MQSFPSLAVSPNITGTYVERHNRARLFINQAGGHIEALVTLTSRNQKFHEIGGRRFNKLADDKRLPEAWGYAGLLPTAREALAYRFCGDHTAGGQYTLSIPDWLGPKVPYAVRAGADGGPVMMHTGILEAGKGKVTIAFEPWFKSRWHSSARTHFAKSFLAGNDELRFSRYDDSPVLLDRYLARESVSFSARTLFWFGALPDQLDRINDFADALYRTVVTIDSKTFELRKTGESYDIYGLMELSRALEPDHLEAERRAEIVNLASRLVR
ncbi:MAG: hypothetical protein AAGA54_32455 [Myxococcota bacterium]